MWQSGYHALDLAVEHGLCFSVSLAKSHKKDILRGINNNLYDTQPSTK